MDIGAQTEQRKPVIKAIKRFAVSLMKMRYIQQPIALAPPTPMEVED